MQVDFGDFDFFRLEEIKAVRYNGGFARFGALEPEGTYVDSSACTQRRSPLLLSL